MPREEAAAHGLPDVRDLQRPPGRQPGLTAPGTMAERGLQGPVTDREPLLAALGVELEEELLTIAERMTGTRIPQAEAVADGPMVTSMMDLARDVPIARPVLAYAAEGKVIDLATFMDAKKLSDEHPATIGLVTQDGKIWGIPYKADVKSTIWYPVKAFAAKGYKVPTTWDELIALSDQIVKDDSNPWCVSAGGPGAATGWQITDWVEEVVLKTKGLDYYNDWISHKVTFEDAGNGKTAYKAVALHANEADREKHEQMGFHDGWGTVAGQLEEFAQSLSARA